MVNLHKTTIEENIFGSFSKHLTSKSKKNKSDPIGRTNHKGI